MRDAIRLRIVLMAALGGLGSEIMGGGDAVSFLSGVIKSFGEAWKGKRKGKG